MAPQQGLQWDGFRRAGARVGQPLLGKVEVFEVVQVIADGFDHVEGLAAPGRFSQALQSGDYAFSY